MGALADAGGVEAGFWAGEARWIAGGRWSGGWVRGVRAMGARAAVWMAGNLTVAWSRVRRGGRYVTGQTRVGPGARRWAGCGIVIRARDRGRRSAGAAVT